MRGTLVWICVSAVANWPTDCQSGPLKAEYGQFRCDQTTRLVKTVSQEARQVKPWLKISAAVFSNYPACKDEVEEQSGSLTVSQLSRP